MRIKCLIIMGSILLACVQAPADDSWVGTPGLLLDWNDPQNWAAKKLPTSWSAIINNGGVALIDSEPAVSNVVITLGHTTSSDSGTVYVRDGGKILATKIIVGNEGTGNLFMEGGIINTVKDFVLAQNSALSTGTVMMSGGDVFARMVVGGKGTGYFTQSGGKILTTNLMEIGRYGNGYYTLTGGELITSNRTSIGLFSGSEGIMSVQGGNRNWKAADNLLIGVTVGTKGTLSFENHTNLFPKIFAGVVNGATGSVVVADSDITVTNGVALSGKGDQVTLSSGRLTITNANSNATLSMGADSYFEQTDGCLTVDLIDLVAGAGPSATEFKMKGGILDCKVKSAFYGGGTFVQTGGVVSNKLFYVLGNAAQVARFEISGGQFTIQSPNNFAVFNTNGCELCVKGSLHDIQFNMFSYTDGVVKPFLMEYILDRTPGHISPIKFTGSGGYACGHLRVALDGGVLLSGTNKFTLLYASQALSFDKYGGYISVPDTDMWNVTLENYKSSCVTLAEGGYKGALTMGATQALGPFAATPMGHVMLTNMQTNRLANLVIRMAVQAGAKPVAEVVADMMSAGYTDSTVETSGVYNVKLSIPVADVVDKAETTTSFFVWDFTKTIGIADIDTVVTNALITSLAVEYDKLPPDGTVISVH
ncbi:MAG: hypothetical protein PHV28_07245 [Kiritimatiellae bacterium]|nr:hypothetical protein [Kiritimatiellia bacterium]